MKKSKDRYQTSYGTSLKDVKGWNNRLKLLLSGGIRKVDPDGTEVPLGRNIKRGIIDPIVGTARGALKIVKPIVKGAYEELYVNPEKEYRKEYQGKKKKYEDKTIDIEESELAGKEVTITEGKDLKIKRGQTENQKEADIILNNSKDEATENLKTTVVTGKESQKKKDELLIEQYRNLTLE